eukprot:6186546-Pleurochrysis_carterae.AAC.2
MVAHHIIEHAGGLIRPEFLLLRLLPSGPHLGDGPPQAWLVVRETPVRPPRCQCGAPAQGVAEDQHAAVSQDRAFPV